jgi:hypothetical protein
MLDHRTQRSGTMENSFMHRGCFVSMRAIKKEEDGEPPHIEITLSIEEVATGHVLVRENRRIQATEAEPITIERALSHCADEARLFVDGKRASSTGAAQFR